MALVLYLDDAMNVLLGHEFIDKGYIDDDGNAELVRSELEQKCYSVLPSKDDKEMDKMRIENSELIQRILKLEGQLAKELAYNDALVKAIRFHCQN